MYHALNQIQWMDVTEGKVYTDEIRHFFRKYIHKTHSFRHGNMMVEEIDFDGMIVKVTDMRSEERRVGKERRSERAQSPSKERRYQVERGDVKSS